MENSKNILKISKEVQNLLNKQTFISEKDLKEIDLTLLDASILESLLNKLNPKEIEATKTKKEKSIFSLYQKENEFLKSNGGKFPDKKSADLYKKIRLKSRNMLLSFVSEKITKEVKESFTKFAKETYTFADISKVNFLDNFNQLSPIKKIQVLNFVKKLQNLK
jgi:hypothetical protein